MLKLNDEKTEVLVMSTPYFTNGLNGTQQRIGDTDGQPNESVCNNDVIITLE